MTASGLPAELLSKPAKEWLPFLALVDLAEHASSNTVKGGPLCCFTVLHVEFGTSRCVFRDKETGSLDIGSDCCWPGQKWT